MAAPVDPTPTDSESSASDPTPNSGNRPVSPWLGLLPALALVVGAVIGGLVVAVTKDDGDDKNASRQPSATPGPSDGPATLTVPEACTAAAETVREATEVLRNGVASFENFQPQEIRRTLNRLEELDTLARQQAELCSATTITDAPDETEAPSQAPNPEPTESPSQPPAPEPSSTR